MKGNILIQLILQIAFNSTLFKAADVICYSDRFADMGIRDVNFCGSQITPGLYDLCDIPDLQGLIAPKPLLVEIGTYDECFKLDSAMSCWRDVEKIYAAAGVRDRLELDLFEGGHQWGGNKSLAFFNKWLGGTGLTLPKKRAAQKTVWRGVDPDEEENPADIAEDVPFAVGGGASAEVSSSKPTEDCVDIPKES